MRRKIAPFLLGLAGMATAYALSLPTYHHLAGLARPDCAECLVNIAQNTAWLAKQQRQAQAAEVTSDSQ